MKKYSSILILNLVCAMAIHAATTSLMTTNNVGLDASLNDFVGSQASSKFVSAAQSFAKVMDLIRWLPEKDTKGNGDAPAMKQKLRAMLVVYKTLDQLLDPNYDPNDRPLMFVSAPGLIAATQVDPATIADEKQRKAYEAAIAANDIKREYVNRQITLRHSLEQIRFEALYYTSHSYQSVNKDEQALLQLAKEIGVSAAFQKELIDALKNGFPPLDPIPDSTPKSLTTPSLKK